MLHVRCAGGGRVVLVFCCLLVSSASVGALQSLPYDPFDGPLYVNADTGDDDTGEGTLTNPFASVNKALHTLGTSTRCTAQYRYWTSRSRPSTSSGR